MAMPPNFIPNNNKYRVWLEEDNLILLKGWARDGLTDKQLAKNMGIAVGTLYEWKKKYHDIADALKKGKEVVDREVENAMLKRALGYDYEEVTLERKTVRDDLTDELTSEMVETKRVKKHVIPDTTAQIIWLKHRKKQWEDKADGSINDEETLAKASALLGGISSVID